MREKIVNVPVRMVLEGARMVRAEYAEGGQLHDWTPAMHAAAEELRAQGAELGEDANRPLLPDECREQGKPPRKMRDGEVRLPSGKPVEMRLCGRFAVKVDLGDYYSAALLCHPDVSRHIGSPFRDPAQYARGLAWWIKNAPADLCLTDDGRSVRTMAPNEVRDVVTGRAMSMNIMRASSGAQVFIKCGDGDSWAWPQGSAPHETHPCSLPSNRLRVEAFLAQQSSITDSVQRRTSCEKPEKAQGDLSSDGAVLPEAHSGSPSGECPKCNGTGRSCGNGRCDYQWCASCTTCNGTGRNTEESDGNVPEVSAPASTEEPSATVAERMQTGGARDIGQSTASVGEAAVVPAHKPPGVPASATIWAEVVDGLGRKVGAWFEGGYVPLVEMWDPDSGHPWSWAPDCESQWMGDFDERMTPSAAAQCRQLYERGTAEMAEIKAWAKNMAGFMCDESIDTGAKAAAVLAAEATPELTLTAVDLTELREAWKVWLGSHNSHDWLRFSNALEKLLSSGGAP